MHRLNNNIGVIFFNFGKTTTHWFYEWQLVLGVINCTLFRWWDNWIKSYMIYYMSPRGGEQVFEPFLAQK